MCLSKTEWKNFFRLVWKLIRRKEPENDDTDAWSRFEKMVLIRAFVCHLFSYVMRLEAWRSEEEIMDKMTQFCTSNSDIPKCDLSEAVPNAVPFVQKLTVAHNGIGLLLCILPFWKIRFAHLILYWWLISEVLLIHKPFEYGINYGEYVAKTSELIWLGFFTSYAPNMVATFVCFTLAQILWPSYVISEDYQAGTQDLVIGMDIPNWIHAVVVLTMIHCCASIIGYNFVAAEAPRVANEKLLNNLDQGVFIMD